MWAPRGLWTGNAESSLPSQKQCLAAIFINKMDINKDLLCSTGNSAQCYLAAWMGGEFGGERIQCLCMTESL